MRLEFTKMHGLGNDFVMIDLVSQHAFLEPEHIRLLADRNFGVGFDQLLLVEPPAHPDVDFRYRIFNADGSEVSQCGNGARCFARFVQDRQLTHKEIIKVETASGVLELRVDARGWVVVNMGAPRFAPEQIPFQASTEALTYCVDVLQQSVTLATVNMGNPHAVIVVADVATAPLATLGAALEKHERFPQKVNVGFMQVVNKNAINLRVFERGTGETLACGSGACAAVVAGIRQGLLASPVQVSLTGGQLEVEWAGEGQPVIMSGPTAKVFEGFIYLSELQKSPLMAGGK